MPLDPISADRTAVPVELTKTDAFRAFVAVVDDAVPSADGLPADIAAAVALVQARVDLGEDVGAEVAEWTAAVAPMTETRVALRDAATATLWPDLALAGLRSGAEIRVPDVSALPRPRVRWPRRRRRTRRARSTERTS